MAVLPYIATRIRVLSGLPVSRRTSIIVGIVAGLGCSLKPLHALSLVFVEAYMLLRGHWRSVLAPLAGATVAIAYAAIVVEFYPEYLDRAVPFVLHGKLV